MLRMELLLFRLEFESHMNRFLFFFSASLLCCAAAAQNPASDPAAGAVPPAGKLGVTETVSPEIVQFQKIEDSWSDAVNRHDQYGLELVLSPLFVDVSAERRRDHAQPASGAGDQRRGQDALPHAEGRHRAHAGRYRRGQRHLHACTTRSAQARWTKKASLRRSSSVCTAAGCASIRSAPCCGRTRARRRRSPRRNRPSTSQTRSPGATRGRNKAVGDRGCPQ